MHASSANNRNLELHRVIEMHRVPKPRKYGSTTCITNADYGSDFPLLLCITSYGPGEHFIGVLSRGIPSRFSLRVSAASAEDEISTHMKTAMAIVDNLAIMSKMDPHVRRHER